MTHPMDVHVGKLIQKRRWMVEMTQQHLAEAVGLKFQQIQEYEAGTSHAPAKLLSAIAEALSVPVAYFLEGFEGDAVEEPTPNVATVPEDALPDTAAAELVRF